MTVREFRDVLITDDDPEVRDLVCAALQKQGFTCDAAADGVAALEYLRTKDYAVLLLDLIMPKVDGFGVLNALAAQQRSGSGPVVLVVTAFDNRDALPAIGEVVHGLIHKPIDLNELVELVSGCITTRRRHVARLADKENQNV